jgi:hypothetical protein
VTAATSGEPIAGAEVSLAGGQLKQPRRTRTDARGRYEFGDIQSGRHRLWASKAGYLSMGYGQRLPSEAAAGIELTTGQTVEGINVGLLKGAVIVARVVDPYAVRVNEGVDTVNLLVQTRPAATIRGRVLVDDASVEGRPIPGSLSVVPAFSAGVSWASGRSTMQDDWSFAITNLLGSGVLRVKGPAGWFLHRVLLGSRDVSDVPLDFNEYNAVPVEIHLTRRQTRLTGTAVDAQGKPTVSYVVVAFAEDRRLWTPHSRLVAAARPDQTGRFTLAGLPPGRYHAVALNYLEAGTERDPRVLERLAPVAVPLTLGEDEARVMDFRIVERY